MLVMLAPSQPLFPCLRCPSHVFPLPRLQRGQLQACHPQGCPILALLVAATSGLGIKKCPDVDDLIPKCCRKCTAAKLGRCTLPAASQVPRSIVVSPPSFTTSQSALLARPSTLPLPRSSLLLPSPRVWCRPSKTVLSYKNIWLEAGYSSLLQTFCLLRYSRGGEGARQIEDLTRHRKYESNPSEEENPYIVHGCSSAMQGG
ncbi:hypothetical protein K438DRAFT_1925331 [Mycena galopus ATCC 62051]|nr:hypothetical protein K438DRAFT_1925331 [Mycena galopus ATCC 62051]